MNINENKKQIPLRLSQKLYEEIAAWAEADFRSINGQIEYLLSECVRKRKKVGKHNKKDPSVEDHGDSAGE
ncbi:MAG TPA: PTS ascorbate transporter subunit IIC [Clostridiales bacterium]|nr:PTS ascorbate transporter subunit IIC [Clostridiales bacterium]